MSFITTQKSSLVYFIEPDFGLLGDLLRLQILDLTQLEGIRSKKNVYKRNAALLKLLKSDDQCEKLLEALKRTGQQHVVNFITQYGGQKHNKFKCTYSSKSNVQAVLYQDLFLCDLESGNAH